MGLSLAGFGLTTAEQPRCCLPGLTAWMPVMTVEVLVMRHLSGMRVFCLRLYAFVGGRVGEGVPVGGQFVLLLGVLLVSTVQGLQEEAVLFHCASHMYLGNGCGRVYNELFEVCRLVVCLACLVDGNFVMFQFTHLWGAGMGLITAEMGLRIAALLAWMPAMLVELLVLILSSGMRLLRMVCLDSG
jgi:hypothetical protein